MIPSFIRQVSVAYRKKHGAPFFRGRRKKNLPLSTRQGLLLILGIGIFVAIVFILVYCIWYLPIGKSVQ